MVMKVKNIYINLDELFFPSNLQGDNYGSRFATLSASEGVEGFIYMLSTIFLKE